MKITNFLAIIALLLLYACEPYPLDEDLSFDGLTSTGLNIRLTDGPIDLDEVNIDLQGVRIKGLDGFEDIALGTNTGIYNLLDYQNGLDTLVASIEDLPFTQIKEIRLILGENNTVLANGATYDLKVPSGSQSGLKIKVCLDLSNEQEAYDLLLDFDACASIHQTGNGKYIMKPVIRVMSPEAKCSDDENDYEEEKEEEDISMEDLPESIIHWLGENYDGYDFDPKKSTFCDTEVYLIKATKEESVIYLYFDLDGNYIQNALLAPNEQLPEAIVNDIAQNYADYQLLDTPTFRIFRPDGKVCFQVRVMKDEAVSDLIYELDGTFICEKSITEKDEEKEEEEEEEEEDYDFTPIADVPQEVINFLHENYGGFDFHMLKTTFCDGTEVYLLQGKKGAQTILLYFDLDWNLLQTGKQFEEKNIPESVLNAIDVDYSNYKIMNNKAWEITRSNDELWYRIYIKKDNSGEKIYVIYAADGTFICQED